MNGPHYLVGIGCGKTDEPAGLELRLSFMAPGSQRCREYHTPIPSGAEPGDVADALEALARALRGHASPDHTEAAAARAAISSLFLRLAPLRLPVVAVALCPKTGEFVAGGSQLRSCVNRQAITQAFLDHVAKEAEQWRDEG